MALGRTLTIAGENTGGTFDLLCVTEQRSIEINNEEIDITKPNCMDPGSKLVLALMYGMQSIRVTGQGAFVNNATMKRVSADAVNQIVRAYQITVPGVGVFEGDGLISMTFSGDKTNEMQSDIRLALTGEVAFEAAV